MRIRTRIFATYVALGLVLVGTAAMMLYDSVGEEARAGIEARVDTGARVAATALEEGQGSANEDQLDALVDALARAGDGRLTLVAPGGAVIADSEFDGAALAALENHARRPEIRAAFESGEGAAVRYSRSIDVDLLYRARRVNAGPWTGSILRMAVPLSRVATAQAQARRELLLAMLVGLAMTAVAGGLLARYLSRPIGELRRAAQRLEAGDVTARARVTTGDELEELAAALNSAAAALAGEIARAVSEKDRLEAVLEGMVEGVVVTDGSGRITLSNAALRELFSLDGTGEGMSPMEALRSPEAADAIAQATVPGKVVVRDVRLTWPVERTLSLHVAALASRGSVGVFHDVTARRRVEEVRRDFVANVSHELQTPLTTLAGYGEALAGTAEDPARVAEIADVIRRQAARMSALVRDLLDLSRLESQGFAPSLERVEVDELVREVAEAWVERAREKGLSLGTKVPPGLAIRGDRRLLQQALANLVENAVRYVPAGGEVRIEASAVGTGVELVVADDGEGIPHEDQRRIFERFYRVEKGRARTRGGTGLGLAIVKHVAEVHGGRVELESSPSQGAIFRIILPTDVADGAGPLRPNSLGWRID